MTLKSAIGTAGKSRLPLPPGPFLRSHGFTLLEILVVVGLIALITAIAAPLVIGGDQHRKLDRGAGEVVEMLDAMGEQSLFLGEFLAVRLHHDRLEPMRFDPVEQRFEPFAPGTPGAPSTVYLDDDLELDWELESPEQTDRRGEEALDPGEVLEDRGLMNGDEDDNGAPQLFFFPSGESSAARLTLERRDLEGSWRRIRLASLGRARIEDNDQ